MVNRSIQNVKIGCNAIFADNFTLSINGWCFSEVNINKIEILLNGDTFGSTNVNLEKT